MKIEDNRKVNEKPISEVEIGEAFEWDSRKWMRINKINNRIACVNLETGYWFYFDDVEAEKKEDMIIPIKVKVVIEE